MMNETAEGKVFYQQEQYKPFIDRVYYDDNHSAELEFIEAVLTRQQCEIFGGEFHLCKDQKLFKKQTGVF